MGNRYLVTEVQIGLLSNPNIELERKQRMIKEILDKQFILNSNNFILEDCKKLTLN